MVIGRPASWTSRLSTQREGLLRLPCPVLDADVHLTAASVSAPGLQARMAATPDYFHGRPMDAEELLAEMDRAGVRLALAWQNPAATFSSGAEAENARALAAANDAVAAAAEAHPGRFLAAGWIDPRALGPERAREEVRTCARERGMFVIKLNPAQNAYPMDGAEVAAVVDAIAAEGAVPAFHFGADTPFTPPAALEALARRLAPHPLIAVHGGGGGASYLEQEAMAAEARAVALRCPNIFVVHSAKRDAHMAADLIAFAAAGPEAWARLALGSDAPYGRMAWNFGGGRALVEQLADSRHPETARRPGFPGFPTGAVADYLGGNAARFLARAIGHFLRHHGQEATGAAELNPSSP